MPLEAGTRIGPYEIVAPLGAGGMGEVYRARDIRLDRTVAVKVLTGALAGDSESRRRFEQEARAIAALNDPHICTIHDVGQHGEHDYLVLEYLDGETLADRLRRSPALTVDEAVAIAIQVGDALARAHRAGIVHRDLKPGNVMMVRRAGPAGPPDVATRPPTAHVAGFSGTLQYMAPEQLDGDPGDHRADIFAFGCVFYEMLAGRKAFEGGTAVTVIAAIMTTEPPPVAALQSANPLLDHVLKRCLEKDRERRWQSIDDVTGELRWIADHPLQAPAAAAVSAWPSRVGRIAMAAALVLATAGLAAMGFALRSRGAPPAA